MDNAVMSRHGEEMPAQGHKFAVVPEQKRGAGEEGRNMKSYQSMQHTWHVANKVGFIY